jgi:Na+:H+ antiporter, NhaA family
VATIAGIGFTVSLLVTDLAFGTGVVADQAKIGIFAGSLIAGVAGYTILRVTARPYRP